MPTKLGNKTIRGNHTKTTNTIKDFKYLLWGIISNVIKDFKFFSLNVHQLIFRLDDEKLDPMS
jgi:hypothetical protein